jgi:hypothetical protein
MDAGIYELVKYMYDVHASCEERYQHMLNCASAARRGGDEHVVKLKNQRRCIGWTRTMSTRHHGVDVVFPIADEKTIRCVYPVDGAE